MNFFAELRRRNVIRMAGLYLVGAWLIVQVAETVLPIFDTPGWVLKVLLVLLALGFVPAVVFAWVYELTPEGLKRDRDIDPAASFTTQTAKRLDQLTLAAVLVLLAVIGADRFWPRAAVPTEEMAAAQTDAPSAASIARQSGLVAVLPFRNRSVREEDAFFAEGIHDDLLTQLSKIPSLKVISRTSMMRYADSDKSVPEIAAELGAAVVLEGAVQRAGDQVRVTVQLIDGATDVHLWAEKYDRALTTETLFAIQADIAEAVSNSMQVVLSPEQSSALRAGSTQNLAAYEAFLRGKLLSGGANISAARSKQAIAEFDRAIALDPGFAAAYARKANIQLLSFWVAVGPRTLREDARESVAQAKRLAPNDIETLLAEAQQFYYGELDYASADQALAKILAQVPDHAEAWEISAYVARRDGRFDDAIAAFERSLSINPQSVDVISALIETTARARGDWDEAAKWVARVRAIGEEPGIREIWLHQWQGDMERAWAAIDGPVASFIDTPAKVAIASRDPRRIEAALSPALWPEDQHGPGDFPEAYAMVRARALLVMGKQAEADRLLAEIKARIAKQSDPYPSRWLGNSYYQPCELPGLMRDLQGVREAEADYLANAPRDVWGSYSILQSLATAFARAGDPERALHYLEQMADVFGPHAYPLISSNPEMDVLRSHPRFLALESRYKAWKETQTHE